MNESLHGQVCVITGASRGIGRATAERLVRAGATVVGTYQSSTAHAKTLAGELSSAQGQFEACRADVRDRAGIAEVIGRTHNRYGRLDCLINNAGIWRGGRLQNVTESMWRDVLETDLTGVFFATQAALPFMLNVESGRIINVSSIVALTGYPGDTIYSAAKAGVIGMTLSLAKEVAGKGVAVNAVAPGSLKTAMTGQLSEEQKNRLLSAIPAGRHGTPEEVAVVIAMLLTAPLYLTGAIIPIAGGM